MSTTLERSKGELAGKASLILGAASGIGQATAEVFAREGAELILSDINEQDGRLVTASLSNQTRAEFVPCDISRSESVQEMIRQARTLFERLNIVVISAGIEGTDAPLHELPEEAFDRVIAVNLRGAFLAMKYSIPWLLESGGGSIVNVASAAGLVGAATMAGYCSSKGGVIQLARVAAIDYAMKGIRVNSVCPGNVDTPMMRREFARRPADLEGMSTMTKMDNLVNRACDPHEVAEAILFLCNDSAPFVLGTELIIDGGKLTR